MKKTLIIVLLLIAALVLGLAACGGGNGSLGDISQYEPEPGEGIDIDVGDDVPGNAIVREDEDGLVSVRVRDGSAEIYFYLDEWGDLNTGQDEFVEGPFQIVTLSGAVVDAMVGKISALDMTGGAEFLVPSVALLTEHGRVEYLMADPAVGWQENEYRSFGVLPWLKDIASFSYEETFNFDGDKTIYVWDSKGYQYNVSQVCRLINIFHEDGVWEFFYTNVNDYELSLGMVLTEDGSMDLSIGSRFGDEPEQTYTGSYEVFLALNGERDSGNMDIDLDCSWWVAELGDDADTADREYWDERMNLTGTYTFGTEGDGYLNLYLHAGDALMYTYWRGEPIEAYYFWQTMFF